MKRLLPVDMMTVSVLLAASPVRLRRAGFAMLQTGTAVALLFIQQSLPSVFHPVGHVFP